MIRDHLFEGDDELDPCTRCDYFKEAHPDDFLAPTTHDRLFNPSRYSPITLGVILQFPRGSLREAQVAACLGKGMAPDGTFRRLRHGERYKCVVVQRTQRKAVMWVARLSPSYWRNLVSDWQGRGVAHKCDRTNLCLFTVKPWEDPCPNCKQPTKSAAHSDESAAHSDAFALHSDAFPHESGDDYGMRKGMGLGSGVEIQGIGLAVGEKSLRAENAGAAESDAGPNADEPPCWHRTVFDAERVCGSCRRRRAERKEVK